jgi:ABC-type transporter MlaC component
VGARRALVVIALVAAAGAAVWARRPHPVPAPVPSPTEPAPVEEEAPAPPPPVRDESAEALVARLLRVLADTDEMPREAREATVAEAIDITSVAPAALGAAWALLTPEQRLVATHDLWAIFAADAIRGARAWLPYGPHVVQVGERGATARVRTIARDDRGEDIEVVFVVAQRREVADALALVDVEIEGVSTVTSYRKQVEHLLAEHDDPAYVVARLARKLARLREDGASRR